MSPENKKWHSELDEGIKLIVPWWQSAGQTFEMWCFIRGMLHAWRSTTRSIDKADDYNLLFHIATEREMECFKQ